MRKPPKLYRPMPGEELDSGLEAFSDSLERVLDWVHEAVEKIEPTPRHPCGCPCTCDEP